VLCIVLERHVVEAIVPDTPLTYTIPATIAAIVVVPCSHLHEQAPTWGCDLLPVGHVQMPKPPAMVVSVPVRVPPPACPQLMTKDRMPDRRTAGQTHEKSPNFLPGLLAQGVAPAPSPPEVHRKPTPTTPRMTHIRVGADVRPAAANRADVPSYAPVPTMRGRTTTPWVIRVLHRGPSYSA